MPNLKEQKIWLDNNIIFDVTTTGKAMSILLICIKNRGYS